MTDQEKLTKLVYLMAEYADNMTALVGAQQIALEDLHKGLAEIDPTVDELPAPENQ